MALLAVLLKVDLHRAADGDTDLTRPGVELADDRRTDAHLLLDWPKQRFYPWKHRLAACPMVN